LSEKRTIKRKAGLVLIALPAVGIFAGLLSVGAPSPRARETQTQNPISRARIVFQQPFPRLDGTHLTAFIVDVRYSSGESSLPHSHPCPLIVYVLEGTVRVHIKGQPEAVYKAGESFYEAPNGVHEVTQNLSSTDAARLIAFFVCDHETPLTVPLER